MDQTIVTIIRQTPAPAPSPSWNKKELTPNPPPRAPPPATPSSPPTIVFEVRIDIGSFSELIGPRVDDWVSINVVDTGHDSLLELLF